MAIGERDSARFECIYDEHVEAVHRYVRRRCPAAADDVTAETFATAWRRLDGLPSEPLPWLLAIARRTLANELRRGRRADALWRRLVGQAGVIPTTPTFDGADPALTRALASLSPAEREAVALIAWEGLTTVQAARVVGASRAAFSMRLLRARRRVAKELARPAVETPCPMPKRSR